MAAKEVCEMQNKLKSKSQASGCNSEEEQKEESMKKKVSKLVFKIGTFFTKVHATR